MGLKKKNILNKYKNTKHRFSKFELLAFFQLISNIIYSSFSHGGSTSFEQNRFPTTISDKIVSVHFAAQQDMVLILFVF